MLLVIAPLQHNIGVYNYALFAAFSPLHFLAVGSHFDGFGFYFGNLKLFCHERTNIWEIEAVAKL